MLVAKDLYGLRTSVGTTQQRVTAVFQDCTVTLEPGKRKGSVA